MKIAYLDCFSGIAGDMLLGALVDCGVDLSALEQEVGRLEIKGIRWQREKVRRSMLMATRVVVTASPDQPHRRYLEIVERIRSAGFSSRVEQQALGIFQRLGEVEASLHGWSLEQVHFHEVGAVDSIADIVGNCIGLELLGIEVVYCSPLNVGGGTVECSHGVLPVPAPATAELLKGIPVYSTTASAVSPDGEPGSRVINSELVTPTGAAIVSALARSFGPLPAMKIGAVGYGAGNSDHPGLPNVLRVITGDAIEAEPGLERLLMLESNLDDMNPQLYGFFAERALAAGALDVFLTPVQMKKNRPGLLLSVLCRPELRETLMGLFFQETTTLGVRSHDVFRRALEREFMHVSTPYGKVRVKLSRQDGHLLNFSPEYEDCRQLAQENAVPLRKVLQEAAFAFWSQCGAGNR